jgi:hypothetical protein
MKHLIAALLLCTSRLHAMEDDTFKDIDTLFQEWIQDSPEMQIVAETEIQEREAPAPPTHPMILRRRACKIEQSNDQDDLDNYKDPVILEKKKICKKCAARFKTLKELNDHVARKHICKESFTCPASACFHKYTTQTSLFLHIKRIHGEKNYSCLRCSKSYAYRGDLTQHIRRGTHKTIIKAEPL